MWRAPSPAEWFALVVMLLTVVVFPSLAADPGLGWHLKAGEEMLARGALLRGDPFLWPPAAHTWILNQWGTEILLAAAFQWGGWGALHVLTELLAWSAHLIIPLLLLGLVALTPTSALMGLLPPVLLGSLQWMIRPQLVSFLFFALLLLTMRRWLAHSAATRACVLGIPLLFFIWANLHPGFFVGFLVLGAAMLESAARAEWRRCLQLLGISGLAVAMTLLNPYGIRLYSESLLLVREPYFMELMSEWQPVQLEDPFFLPFWIIVSVLALSFVTWVKRRSESALLYFDWLIAAVLILATLEHRRFLPYFGIAAVLPTAIFFEQLRVWLFPSRRALSLRVSAVTVLGMCLIALCGNLSWWRVPSSKQKARAYESYFPITVIEDLASFVDDTHAPIRVFNHPNWGGVIVGTLWPRGQVFIDDRNELNGVARYKDYRSIADASPRGLALFDALNFDAVLVSPGVQLAKTLREHPRYSLVSENEDAVLFILSTFQTRE